MKDKRWHKNDIKIKQKILASFGFVAGLSIYKTKESQQEKGFISLSFIHFLLVRKKFPPFFLFFLSFFQSYFLVGLSIRGSASGRSIYIQKQEGASRLGGTYMGKYRAAGIEWLFSGYYQTKNNNIKRVLVSIKIYKGYIWYARQRVADLLSIKVLNIKAFFRILSINLKIKQKILASIGNEARVSLYK